MGLASESVRSRHGFGLIKESWGKAAAVLAAGGSKSEAASAAGVTARTVHRWLSDEPQFGDTVDEARSEMLRETAGLLAHATTSAARKLAEIIAEGEDTHALRAAQTVLDMASRYRANQALEARIRSLEISAGLRTAGEW